jgi:hypothetical protein
MFLCLMMQVICLELDAARFASGATILQNADKSLTEA